VYHPRVLTRWVSPTLQGPCALHNTTLFRLHRVREEYHLAIASANLSGVLPEHRACRRPTEVDHTYIPGHWPIKANLNTQSCQSVKNSTTTPCNHACLPPSYEMSHVPTAQGPDSLLFTHIQLEQTHPPINFLISASFFTLSPFMRRTVVTYSTNRENARPHAQVSRTLPPQSVPHTQ
jgi:hypothetical protein